MRRGAWLTRTGALLLTAALLLGAAPSAFAAEPETVWLTGRFDSPAYPGRELSFQFPYRDDYFTLPATNYHHPLAQCTLGMAVSAFRAGDLDLDRKDAYIRDYLTQAGFGDMVSQQFDEEPRADTIATLIASKPLQDEEGEFLLIAAAVSGGGYEDEWLSNFSFGDDSVHEGFFSAAYTVFQRVFDYVDDHAQGRRVKLWMGGYSRAAAVSNMAAVLALSAEQIAPEDLYVYTFATPNNIRLESVDAELNMDCDYSSIYNVVGMFDPVPSIPFAEWGYHKLGTTFYLPAQETTPDYMTRREPVTEIYRSITGSAFSNNPEANWFIQKLYQLIFDMTRTAGSYQEKLEGVIQEAWTNRASSLKLLGAICSTLSHDGDIDAMLLDEAPSADTLLSVFLYDLAMEKLSFRPSSWNDLGVMMQLFYEHCPEVYVSWMMSQSDPAGLFVVDTNYRRVFLDSQIDYALMDEDGQAVETVCAASLGRTTMLTVPSDRTYVLALSGGKAGQRIKVVEYSAGSLHYAYQLFTMETPDCAYELTLPMEFWSTWDDGGLVQVPEGERVSPAVQALDRTQIHPSAVFEIEDSGFLASYALNIALAAAVVVLLAVVALLVICLVIVLRKTRRKTPAGAGEIENGGTSHE